MRYRQAGLCLNSDDYLALYREKIERTMTREDVRSREHSGGSKNGYERERNKWKEEAVERD